MVKRILRELQLRFVQFELTWARLTGDEVETLEAELELGRLRGDFTKARQVALKQGNESGLARSSIGLAAVAIERNDYETARTTIQSELLRLRRLGDPGLLADALLKLGGANDKLGNAAEGNLY